MLHEQDISHFSLLFIFLYHSLQLPSHLLQDGSSSSSHLKKPISTLPTTLTPPSISTQLLFPSPVSYIPRKMKIQCDVCNKEEASIYCCPDEAALCERCDLGVHHANKLASKHSRFSLTNPSSKDAPKCDICQERRAFLFCQEDRAILCRECDVPIHTANDLTARHSRFLLTGVKISSLQTACSSDRTGITQMENKEKPTSNCDRIPAAPSPELENHGNTSSISEYLIKTLPGWHVEDLLVDGVDHFSATTDDGFCKNDDLWKIVEGGSLDLVSDDQVPQISFLDGLVCEFGKDMKEAFHQRGWRDHGFTVPQLNPSLKRSRPVWQI